MAIRRTPIAFWGLLLVAALASPLALATDFSAEYRCLVALRGAALNSALVPPLLFRAGEREGKNGVYVLAPHAAYFYAIESTRAPVYFRFRLDQARAVAGVYRPERRGTGDEATRPPSAQELDAVDLRELEALSREGRGIAPASIPLRDHDSKRLKTVQDAKAQRFFTEWIIALLAQAEAVDDAAEEGAEGVGDVAHAWVAVYRDAVRKGCRSLKNPEIEASIERIERAADSSEPSSAPATPSRIILHF